MKGIQILLVVCAFVSGAALPQTSVTLTVDTTSRLFKIPDDFVGLGFETKSVLPDTYGVRGYFFTPTNTQLITLFRNIGIKQIRVGGATADGSGNGERCATPIPDHQDIDNLFEFARAADIKVVYSLRLLNVSSCANPHLAEDDAKTWDQKKGKELGLQQIWHDDKFTYLRGQFQETPALLVPTATGFLERRDSSTASTIPLIQFQSNTPATPSTIPKTSD